MFYTYLWLREDGTPYYAGKGSGKRAFEKHLIGNAPPKYRILIEPHACETDAFEVEKFFISYYGRKDIGTGILLNFTDGGEGVSGMIFIPEMRAHMSAAHIGKVHSTASIEKTRRAHFGSKRSLETKRRISEAGLGRKPTNEARENMRKAGLGRKQSEETKAKKSAALKGRPLTEETKAKLRVSAIGRKATDETKQKISKAGLGRKHSVETLKKMSASAHKRWNTLKLF